MMLWRKCVGESRVECSRVMVTDARRHVDKKTQDEQIKTKEFSTGRQAWLEEIRDRKGLGCLTI